MWVRRIGTRSDGLGLVIPIQCARAMKLSKKDFVVIRMVEGGKIEICKFEPGVLFTRHDDKTGNENYIEYE